MTAVRETKRTGATLIEVLIAIFVMVIGLLCVLTLFVLGAQRMATAFKDDACARAAVNARAFAEIKGLRTDQDIAQKFSNNNGAKDQTQPSDPIFVDPAGTAVAGPTLGASSIVRTGPSYAVDNSPTSLQYFALLDDVTYQKNAGVPKLLGGSVEREINYTWAYMLQRDRLGEPLSATAQVCVFNRRPKGGQLETAYPGSMLNPNDNSIILPVASGTVNISPGNWALDVSDEPIGKKYKLANFYRISGVRDEAGKVRLDLQSPLKGYGTTPNVNGTVIIMEGLVEVFDLGYGAK